MFINKKSLNLRRRPFKHKINNVVSVSENVELAVVETAEIKSKTNQTTRVKKNNISEEQKD